MPDRRDFLTWTGATLGLTAFAETAEAQAPSTPTAPLSAALPTMNPPPPKVGSHLGSLYPLVKGLAAGPDFPLSFLNDEFRDLAAWKERGLARVRELMYYDPPKVAPAAEIVERLDRGDYIQENLTFATTPLIRVPAALLIPKRAKLPAPAVVALHDHGGFYLWGREKLLDNADEHPALTEMKAAYDNRPIAVELVRRGYVVIVIDMFYWGERRLVLDDDAADFRDRPRSITPDRVVEFNRRSAANEQLLGRTLYAAGTTWPGIMTTDDVRTVDYLASRPEVDANRIGCVGHSIGGLRATHLALLDPRIKAAVCCGWMCSFPRQLYKNVRSTIGPTKLLPGLYREMDYPDLAALAMPCAQLFINGRKDGLFDFPGVEESFQKLSACYKKAGLADKFRGSVYDTPHEFNTKMQAEAWEWFERWLA
jgi:dienelactone hydrolase